MSSIVSRLKAGSPLGPFDVGQLLKDRKHINRAKTKKDPLGPTLNSVILYQNEKIIGLNHISNKDQRNQGSVYFEGVLHLAEESWLSEDGARLLCQEIAARIGTNRNIDYILHAPSFEVEVTIIGTLFAEPYGLDTEGLLRFASYNNDLNQKNEFVINSMHVSVYDLSAEYIAKHSLLKAIRDVINRCQAFPVHDRTPAWLVKEYINMYKERYEEENATDTQIPRRVKRAEIYALFAHHSDFLSEMIKRFKLLNETAWMKFKNKVETYPADGGAEKWQDWDALEREWDLDDDAIMVSSTADPTLNRGVGEDTGYTDRDYSNTYRYLSKRETSRSLSPETVERYYSDERVLAALPKVFYTQEPVFPADAIWHCPDDKCPHAINFQNLQDEDLDGLSRPDRKYLRRMLWTPTEEKFIELFYDIVELHYAKHIEDLEIKHVVSRYDGSDVHGQPIYRSQETTGPRQMLESDVDFRFECKRPFALFAA